MASSAEQAVVDALPYFDKGYDETGVREAALTLVEEEMRRYRPTKNYLEHLPPVNTRMFETAIIHSEFERLANRLPMEMLSMRRYELPPPPAGKLTDVRAWQQAVENSQAQLEHQAMRIANLETMTSYGMNAWKVYNECLQRMLLQAERQLQELRKRIQEINWQRKNEQTDAGEKLIELEENWVGLVGKNYEIERAIVDLETEVQEKNRRLSR